MSQITPEQVPESGINRSMRFFAPEERREIIAETLNDPAIRRLVVTACVEEAWDRQRLPHTEKDEWWGDVDHFVATLCPTETQ